MRNTSVKILTCASIFLIFAFGCSSDDSNDDKFKCCTEEIGNNVNNLGTLYPDINEDITVFNIVTPNEDGINDTFIIINLGLYPNNVVTIFDRNNNKIFETENYGMNNNFFPNEVLEDGSYIYKVVIENEETFLRQGYLCIINDFDNDFEGGRGCNASQVDPILQ